MTKWILVLVAVVGACQTAPRSTTNAPATQIAQLSARRAQMITVPPICPLAASPYDFSHAGEMIDKAARSTERWLEQGGLTDSEPLAAAQERSIATARVRARDVAIELGEACGAQLPSCVVRENARSARSP